MVSPNEVSLTTCFPSSSTCDGQYASGTPLSAYDQVLPTSHPLHLDGFVNAIEALPDVLKDTRPVDETFRSLSTLNEFSHSYRHHQSFGKRKKRSQGRRFVDLGNYSDSVFGSSRSRVKVKHQQTYADVVQDIDTEGNNQEMSPAQRVQPRVHEELELAILSSGSVMSSHNCDSVETSSSGTGTSLWYVSPALSSHFGDDESSVDMKGVSGSPVLKDRQKMAEEFCFGELETNHCFSILWDLHCLRKNRLEYALQLTGPGTIQGTEKATSWDPAPGGHKGQGGYQRKISFSNNNNEKVGNFNSIGKFR